MSVAWFCLAQHLVIHRYEHIANVRFAIYKFYFRMYQKQGFTIPIEMEATGAIANISLPLINAEHMTSATTKDKRIIMIFIIVLNVHLRGHKTTIGVDIIVGSFISIVIIIMI